MEISKYFPEHQGKIDILAELQDYQKDLEILAEANVSIQFTNKGKDHAVLVMSKLFNCAYRNVKIFARDFNGSISDNQLYIDSLKNFLARDPANIVTVIFEGKPNPSSKALALLKKIRSETPQKVILKKAEETQIIEFSKYLVNAEKMIHFTVADDEMKGYNKYRCETDTNNFLAILNFDDNKFCQKLLKLYSILEVNAKEIAN